MDSRSKAYLDKNFNYEIAIVALTSKDYDRARFYLDRETNELLAQWRNLTKLSQVAQHILVQKVQKLYEMKEFLSSMKHEGMISKQEAIPLVMKSIAQWMQRIPSYAFDKISVWDDVITARYLYLDLYNYRWKGEFQVALRSQPDLVNVRAILKVQSAKGAFKMGLYDCSDTYLRQALKLRQGGAGAGGAADDNSNNMKIVGPIIKLKSEQFKSDAINLKFSEKSTKLAQIISVLDKKMNTN